MKSYDTAFKEEAVKLSEEKDQQKQQKNLEYL